MKRLFGVEVAEGALCPIAKLHGFEPVEEIYTGGTYITGATIEYCRYCGEQRIYKKVHDRLNNRVHVEDHLRDTVQPTGRTARLFEWLFGKVIDNRGATERRDIF